MIRMKRNKQIILPCFIGVVLCLLIAGIEGWVTASNTNSWYHTLNKPVFNPPSFVFGPIWTVLYIMIGIAGGLIWNKRKQHKGLWILFLIQLLFNFLWSFLFFLWESISWALIDISLLWITLLIILICAYRTYRVVAYWLTPYFIWVSFAALLNVSLWILN
ncbi:MAG: hypothetical protein CMF39_01810 [Legionellaceae bacterium]|nr:hypothetical protein [Legionellaceae bacterium]|tara:strand:- start:1132 stop:1614 length:483 start_codon:yes stop_codon:yes gene_type:complete